ncbi:MAG: EamA family transporter [Chitinophagaceae bacterium]|nr:EamA family transporter [Chitinophagaceae bacterium]
MVNALWFGKASIVVPVTALAPVITIIISLILYSVVPHPITMVGLLLAAIAIYLMAE